MLGVYIYELQDGKDTRVGSIRLVNGQLHAFPQDDALLQEILKTPIRGNKYNPRPILPQADPLRFLVNLQYHYKSAYLRASSPTSL